MARVRASKKQKDLRRIRGGGDNDNDEDGEEEQRRRKFGLRRSLNLT
jgi:hypothetical protein